MALAPMPKKKITIIFCRLQRSASQPAGSAPNPNTTNAGVA